MNTQSTDVDQELLRHFSMEKFVSVFQPNRTFDLNHMTSPNQSQPSHIPPFEGSGGVEI
jgi:hypothetical protein